MDRALNASYVTGGPRMILRLEETAPPATAAIGTAPIGFDRMLGYGLNDPSGFGDTHPGRIGRAGTVS